MARLFITPREIDFINDIGKEIIKDVIGQKIFYYSVSEVRSKVHDVYDEAVDKIFDDPIEINCIVEYQPEEIRTGRFSSEEYYSIEAYIPDRDMIDKEIELVEGDFFTYGSYFFEIVSVVKMRNIYGQAEHSDGIKLLGREARESQFQTAVLGPVGEDYVGEDVVQDSFYQQRGFDTNHEGETGDVRALQDKGVLDMPISERPGQVSSKGDETGAGSAFYDEVE